jgi:hypothetical protein
MRSLIALAVLTAPAASMAATMYVDQNIGSSCANYDPGSRSCGPGSSQAYSSLGAGLGAVDSGDTLLLRAGNYGQISAQSSGTASQPIVIEGFSGESVVVSSGSIGLSIINQSNITFRNLVVNNVEGFGRIENSSGIIFDSIAFSNASASGTTGSLKFVRANNNKVLNSTFDDGSDLLILQDDANFNVIQGNSFASAAHSQISIRCASQNVIRGNEFDNPDQKAMEIYDCEGVSDAPVRLDDAKRNVLEFNRFLGTASSGSSNNFNAIQHGAQQTIVRQNVYADNLGGGINYQYYSDESLFVYENRLYNNTFYNNRCFGIIGQSGPGNRFYDNRVVNNLLFQNSSCNGGGGQVSISDSGSVILSNNSQVNSDPGFANANARDLSLTSGSNQIDAGAFITTAASGGSGTSLVVGDASWFYDGFGIAGETGDEIQIEGQSGTAFIASIDYPSNTITLSASLTWNNGDGVHLKYAGNAPDVGAFEFGSTPTNRPNPPTSLDVN